jgi:hypothetical protein
MKKYTMRSRRRKADLRLPDLFDWQHNRDLLSTPTIRSIVRRTHVSPALAAVIAELCGYTRETR